MKTPEKKTPEKALEKKTPEKKITEKKTPEKKTPEKKTPTNKKTTNKKRNSASPSKTQETSQGRKRKSTAELKKGSPKKQKMLDAWVVLGKGKDDHVPTIAILEKMATGGEISQEDLVKLTENEKQIDELNSEQIFFICKQLNLSSYGPTSHLRSQVKLQANKIKGNADPM